MGQAPENEVGARYGSDVVVDLLQEHGIEYVAMNPGASFRGLHDSLVNYAAGSPAMLETPHEKIAVGMAHGYAKVTGRPMGVITHDLVGLLHATLGIYYAYLDRVPMLVLGGAGPMDGARRRPWIDWIHTANVQNTAVRDYTKWDDHPYSVEAIPESVARGLRVANAEPAGPVYIALDADLQEQPLDGSHARSVAGDATPTRVAADPAALTRLAEVLVSAERPVIVTGSVGRDPATWPVLVELVELLGAAVVDTNIRLSFPTDHPQNLTGTPVFDEADVVLTLDVKDIGQHTQLLTKADRGGRPRLAKDAVLLDIGFGDIGISSWSADYGGWFPAEHRVVADTSLAVPALLDTCRRLVAGTERTAERQARRQALAARHRQARAGWQEEARREPDGGAMSPGRLVAAVGDAIAGHDWVLTAGTGGWATKLWDFEAPHRHPGRSLGTATQIGISLGVALAHRGSGRLVVDLQPDGDLMFDASALWVAARHRIPMLVVMVNNRAWNNDWVHQREVARDRGTPLDNTGVGIVIEDPAPDFAGLARSLGWHAAGPFTDPAEAESEVRKAADLVVTTGRPALVDVVCSAHG